MEQIFKKKYTFGQNQKKNEHHYWILHNQISLSANFQLKLTDDIFLPNLSTKSNCFLSKTDKIDITIEFCIFELVFVSNFTLNKQFWIFGKTLPKRDIYVQKQKKWTSSLNSANSNYHISNFSKAPPYFQFSHVGYWFTFFITDIQAYWI